MGNARDLLQVVSLLAKGAKSTADIQTVLFRASHMKTYGDEVKIKEKDPVIAMGTRLIGQLTHQSNDVKPIMSDTNLDQFKQIETLRNEAQTYLDSLGGSRNTSSFQQQYLPIFSTLNKTINEITNDRALLSKEEIGALDKEQQKNIPEILDQYTQGKISSTEAMRQLQSYQSKQASFDGKLTAIKEKQNSVLPQLTDLVRKTKEVYYSTQDITVQQNLRPS